jgi:nitrous oxidase accessory protein
VVALGVALLSAAPSGARTLVALPGEAPAALAAAAGGDTVVLRPGVHPGTLRVRRAIVLRGEPGAVVDGSRSGSAVEVAASRATVEDLEIRGSGRDVMNVDAGVHVIAAEDVRLSRLRVRDVLYGVNGERARRLRIEQCVLTGTVRPGDAAGTGNGIHLWYGDSAVVTGSRASRFLDAVYLSFAHDAHIERNELADCGRYGLHTMYCQRGRLVANRFTRNEAGCAIMFSNGLWIEGNDFVHNRGSRTYGLLLRDCSAGDFLHNRVVDNTVGVFMDNSNRNRFAGNLVEDNGWGVLLFASCQENVFTGNNFVQNDYPVALDMRRTRNRFDDGAAGNYWSENAPYDLDADGVGDVPFSPVTAFAFVSKQYPDLTLLAKSPAVAALGVAERVFPALRPSEAVDRFPRVTPAVLPAFEAPGGAPRAAAAWPAAAGFAGFGAAAAWALARPRARGPAR